MRSIPRRDNDAKNSYSRSFINGIMKATKVALKHAARLDIIPKNPANKIELLADDSRQRDILSPAELERLFRLEWSDERGKSHPFWRLFPVCAWERLLPCKSRTLIVMRRVHTPPFRAF